VEPESGRGGLDGVDLALDGFFHRAWLGRFFFRLHGWLLWLVGRADRGVAAATEDFLVAADAWHEVARQADQLIAFVEEHAHAFLLAFAAAWLQAVQVIPTVGVEGVLDQRVTHDKPYLPAGHSGAQLVYHVLRNDIALLDVDFVNPGKRATGECEQSREGEAV
jgi:hypothetical protein